MTPTREQLASIEWAAKWDGETMCPACLNLEHDGHAPDCWLAACLAAPPHDTFARSADVPQWSTVPLGRDTLVVSGSPPQPFPPAPLDAAPPPEPQAWCETFVREGDTPPVGSSNARRMRVRRGAALD